LPAVPEAPHPRHLDDQRREVGPPLPSAHGRGNNAHKEITMRHTRFASTTASIAAAMVLLSACSGTSGTGAAPAESGGDGAADLNTAIAAVTPEQLDGTTIQLARMFGDCEETTAGVTDTSKAGTECEAIQILTNKFNAENDYGIT